MTENAPGTGDERLTKHGACSGLKYWVKKITTLVVAGLILGWVYEWAAPRFYRPEVRYGFGMGAVHGALMPTALPGLLMGKDLPIFAVGNAGRWYKVGYIAGINLCGLFFFGLAFKKPEASR